MIPKVAVQLGTAVQTPVVLIRLLEGLFHPAPSNCSESTWVGTHAELDDLEPIVCQGDKMPMLDRNNGSSP